MKKLKSMRTLWITLVTIAALALGASGALAADTPATDAQKYQAGAIQVTKVLKSNKGTTVNATFSYTATQTSTGGPTATVADISINKASDDATVTGTGAITFGPLDSVIPGVYTYTLAETKGAEHFAAGGATEDLMTYDTNTYTMRVYVENGADDKQITAVTVTNDATGEKVSGEDGIKFTNTYWKDGGSDNDKDTSFTVSKDITGKSSDLTKKFDFTVTFTKPDVLPTDGFAPTFTASGGVTVTPSADKLTYTFSLTRGEKVTFNNVTAGATYRVVETQDAKYSVADYTVTANGQTVTSPANNGAVVGANFDTGAQLVGEKANAVAVTNQTADNPITGILTSYLPMITLIAAVLAAGAVYVAVKRRSAAR